MSTHNTKIAIGSDHAGIELKIRVIDFLISHQYEPIDCGPTAIDGSVDYPDYAKIVAQHVVSQECSFGILICGTGIGMSIAANKVPGIRATLVYDENTARLSREHNNANIFCLGARTMTTAKALELVQIGLTTAFQATRHTQRLEKISKIESEYKNQYIAQNLQNHSIHQSQHSGISHMTSSHLDMNRAILEKTDPEIAFLLHQESDRLNTGLELIASENVVSPAVLAAVSSVLTNKYAEGYPGKRYYGGCEFNDAVETIAIERAKQIFGAEHANVQPHSGAQANQAVFFAVLKPGDVILGMNLSHGGHLTHGSSVNLSGIYYKPEFYGVNEHGLIDYDDVREKARACRPKMIIAGASAYPRSIDFQKFREICDEVGAFFMVDMAHIAGLVACKEHPDPVPFADFVTTTTHKTLRGPRGGLILCSEKFSKIIDKAVFPGIQGGPLMHVIGAKAVAFGEALQPEFKHYIRNVVTNARVLAKHLMSHGLTLLSGGTDNHLMLIDLRASHLSGKDAETRLSKIGLTVNKNSIPNDPRKPMITSGIRIGTPAITTRGLVEHDMEALAKAIAIALLEGDEALEGAHQIVKNLCTKYPLYNGSLMQKGYISPSHEV